MDDYTKKPGYAHYKSAQFAKELFISLQLFNTMVFGRWVRYPRPWGYPNTPRDDLDDDESTWSSDDGYQGQPWGPDEDHYISVEENCWC